MLIVIVKTSSNVAAVDHTPEKPASTDFHSAMVRAPKANSMLVVIENALPSASTIEIWLVPARSRVPPRPNAPGVHVFADWPLADLVERIDWTPFFATWELRGAYPPILDDPKVGAAATDLFRDAQALLERIVREGRLRAAGVVGFWPANADGDDIAVWRDAERQEGMIPILVDLYGVLSVADVAIRFERAYARQLKGKIRARIEEFLQSTGLGLSLGALGGVLVQQRVQQIDNVRRKRIELVSVLSLLPLSAAIADRYAGGMRRTHGSQSMPSATGITSSHSQRASCMRLAHHQIDSESGKEPRGVAALTFAFGGFAVAQTHHTNISTAAIWVISFSGT